jgi:hypothetical protein
LGTSVADRLIFEDIFNSTRRLAASIAMICDEMRRSLQEAAFFAEWRGWYVG